MEFMNRGSSTAALVAIDIRDAAAARVASDHRLHSFLIEYKAIVLVQRDLVIPADQFR